MKCGNAYLLYDDENPNSQSHLHIVISDPDKTGSIVLVSVTTQRAKSDTTTCLEAGCHPFIDNPSVVAYQFSKIMTCAQLKALIDEGEARPKATASEEIVKQAQAGMQETRRAPREVQECFMAWQAQKGQESNGNA